MRRTRGSLSVPEAKHKGQEGASPTSGRLEVRLSGSGGQGIQTAALLLAAACLRGGRTVVQTQSYGPAARGGASKAEVVVSDEEIDYPQVRLPLLTLCLSQDSFNAYAAETVPGGTVYYDDGLVEPAPVQGVALRSAPFATLAGEELGVAVVASVVALAALYVDAGLGEVSDLEDAVRRYVPERFVEVNLKAVELGTRLRLERRDAR